MTRDLAIPKRRGPDPGLVQRPRRRKHCRHSETDVACAEKSGSERWGGSGSDEGDATGRGTPSRLPRQPSGVNNSIVGDSAILFGWLIGRRGPGDCVDDVSYPIPSLYGCLLTGSEPRCIRGVPEKKRRCAREYSTTHCVVPPRIGGRLSRMFTHTSGERRTRICITRCAAEAARESLMARDFDVRDREREREGKNRAGCL